MQLASVVQPVGHVVSVPSQTNGVQLGDPAAPLLSSVQVPLAVAPPAVVHALQAPVQAELQQTPSAQKPEMH
jgi:hypothetical protein